MTWGRLLLASNKVHGAGKYLTMHRTSPPNKDLSVLMSVVPRLRNPGLSIVEESMGKHSMLADY